jgi:hypothetical protein
MRRCLDLPAMSLINGMLHDLEARRWSPSRRGGASPMLGLRAWLGRLNKCRRLWS